jgi:hypothetical protein
MLTVCPVINEQPSAQYVVIGQDASFSVGYPESSVLYQWQTNLGLGWQNLYNAGQYSGTSTPTLVVSKVKSENNSQVFRCLIGYGACRDTSDTAVLMTVVSGTGYHNEKISSRLYVYPNPVNEFMHVNVSPDLIHSAYIIIDIAGRTILYGELENDTSRIDTQELSPGIYFLKTINQNIQPVKFIKK